MCDRKHELEVNEDTELISQYSGWKNPLIKDNWHEDSKSRSVVFWQVLKVLTIQSMMTVTLTSCCRNTTQHYFFLEKKKKMCFPTTPHRKNLRRNYVRKVGDVWKGLTRSINQRYKWPWIVRNLQKSPLLVCKCNF